MNGLVDSSGNDVNTKEDGKEPGVANGAEGEKASEQKAPVAQFIVEKDAFVVRIPIYNNVYQVLGHLIWAEDKIRQIYANAQMAKEEKKLKLANPGFLRNFANKWKR